MNWEPLSSILFPRRCAPCGAMLRAGAACETCFRKFSLKGAPLPGAAFARLIDSGRFPYLIGAAADYGAPGLAALIRALKFRGLRAAAEPVADLLASYALPFRRLLRGYTVVPLPLSRERLRMRGFNQAGLIAASFARRLDLPLSPGALIRIKHAKPQTDTVGVTERTANVEGCFAAPRAVARAARGGFLIIDDVTTTGATLLSAARALAPLRAAAHPIIALAAAKA